MLALAPDPAAGAPAVVLCRPDGRPPAVVDAGAVAAVPAAAAAATPATAVSYALGAGAYVPEWSRGQELIQYLAQLDGQEYAVVDHDGTVTGLLRQSAVLGAITGKECRRRQADRRAKAGRVTCRSCISGPGARPWAEPAGPPAFPRPHSFTGARNIS